MEGNLQAEKEVGAKTRSMAQQSEMLYWEDRVEERHASRPGQAWPLSCQCSEGSRRVTCIYLSGR